MMRLDSHTAQACLEENAAIAVGIDAERRGEMKKIAPDMMARDKRGADDLGGRDEEQDRGDELALPVPIRMNFSCP